MQRCADGDEGGGCGRGANTEEIFRTFDEEHSSARETRSPRGVFAEYYAILHEYTLALHASTGSEQDLITLDSMAQAAAVAYSRGLANVPQVSFDPAAILTSAAVYIGKGVLSYASSVTFYRGGNSLTFRQFDVKIDPQTGQVLPGRGISVNTDPKKVEKYGGAYSVDHILEGLEIVKTGRDPGHYEIGPSAAMAVERYAELLRQIILTPFR